MKASNRKRPVCVCHLVVALLLMSQLGLAQAILPPTPLPGRLGSANGFGLAEIRDGGTISNLPQAVELVKDGFDDLANVALGEVPLLDVSDFERRSGGGEVLPGIAFPLLGDPPGEETPNTVSVAHGRLRVAEAGQYTIQVHSSDGFAMRFPGHQWDQVFSWNDERTAEIDPHDPETLLFRDRIGDTNTRGVITLPKGDLDFEFLHFGGGLSYLTGVYFEVTSALGIHEFQQPAQWLALGDGSVIPAATPAPRDIRLTAPAELIATDEVVRRLDEMAEAVDYSRNEMPEMTRLLDPVVVVDEDGVDGRDVCCARPALAVPESLSSEIPFGDRRTYIAAGVFGEFAVDDGDEVPNEKVPLTFALFADDVAQLRIVGEEFESFNDGVLEATDIQLADGSSDHNGIQAYLSEMSHNPLAFIELTEGTYEFETYLLQQVHDMGLEIWVATGFQDWFDLSTFYPLGMSDKVTPRPRNVGLQLIDIVDVLLGDFDRDGLLTEKDLDLLSIQVASSTMDLALDVDANGQLDQQDVVFFLSQAGKLNGDANFDGEVTFADFLTLSANFGTKGTSWSEGDFNASGGVDFADFLILSANFGRVAEALHSVPEPSSDFLSIASGILCLFFFRFRTRG